jgi:hypothetical protein
MANPSKPGFYWAKWISPAQDTHEKEEYNFAYSDWEVVHVWENERGLREFADWYEKNRVE